MLHLFFFFFFYRDKTVTLETQLRNISEKAKVWGDFPGGPVAKTPCSQCRGARVQSPVRELDPTCHN